jgi:hypothetical protein
MMSPIQVVLTKWLTIGKNCSLKSAVELELELDCKGLPTRFLGFNHHPKSFRNNSTLRDRRRRQKATPDADFFQESREVLNCKEALRTLYRREIIWIVWVEKGRGSPPQ